MIRDLLGSRHNWNEITKEEEDAIWEKFDEIIEYIKHARNLKSILNRFSFRDKGKKERIVHYSSEFRDTELLNNNVYVLDLYRDLRISKRIHNMPYIVHFAFQFIASPVIDGKCKIVMLNNW